MAVLPPKPNPTIQAIWAAYEASQDHGYREHLGGSLIGAECERAIWYSFRWATRAHHTGRLLRLFQTGHLAESRFVADLRAIGVQVLDFDPDTGKQWKLRDETGHFGGSMDGVGLGFIEAEKTWHLCEFKTHNQKSFEALCKDGLEKSKPQHYAQMQTYMHLAGLDRGFYLAANKNDDNLYQERIKADIEIGIRLVAKAQRIIKAETPPARISEDPSWYLCRFCDHHAVCHEGAKPAPHCRSCLRATPVADGAWHCANDDTTKTFKEQIAGCLAHLYLPTLIDGEQVDADEKGTWVSYRMKDGSTFIDGCPF